MKKRQFATSLSCRHCNTVGKRIFDVFKKEGDIEDPKPYILLRWIGCASEKCRNLFTKPHSLSRCPVCQLWSVKLSGDGEMQEWTCLNPECHWSVSLFRLES